MLPRGLAIRDHPHATSAATGDGLDDERRAFKRLKEGAGFGKRDRPFAAPRQGDFALRRQRAGLGLVA